MFKWNNPSSIGSKTWWHHSARCLRCKLEALLTLMSSLNLMPKLLVNKKIYMILTHHHIHLLKMLWWPLDHNTLWQNLVLRWFHQELSHQNHQLCVALTQPMIFKIWRFKRQTLVIKRLNANGLTISSVLSAKMMKTWSMKLFQEVSETLTVLHLRICSAWRLLQASHLSQSMILWMSLWLDILQELTMQIPVYSSQTSNQPVVLNLLLMVVLQWIFASN